MDLTQDVIYRGYTLNDADIRDNIIGGAGTGAGIAGSIIETSDISDIDVVQFREKRSQGDGMDVGDVHFGGRRVNLAGTLYHRTRALLFDEMNNLRAALNAVLAQRESPEDKGYQPLYFTQPTNRIEDYPSGVIDLRIDVMPVSFQDIISRDETGGDETDPLAIPWRAVLFSKDGAIKGATPIQIDVIAEPDGDLTNRGTYIVPANLLLVIDEDAQTITAQVGDGVLVIDIEASTGERIIRYNGVAKTLNVEEDGINTLRMDLLDFSGETTHPLISPGDSPYSVTTDDVDGFGTGSILWYYEQYA